MWHSALTDTLHRAECHDTECRVLFIVMLSVVMLSVVAPLWRHSACYTQHKLYSQFQCSATMLSIIMLGDTFFIVRLSVVKLRVVMLNVIVLSVVTLSVIMLIVLVHKGLTCDTQHKQHSALLCSTTCWVSLCRVSRFFYCYAECSKTEGCYAECRYDECRYNKCRYDECRGAVHFAWNK